MAGGGGGGRRKRFDDFYGDLMREECEGNPPRAESPPPPHPPPPSASQSSGAREAPTPDTGTKPTTKPAQGVTGTTPDGGGPAGPKGGKSPDDAGAARPKKKTERCSSTYNTDEGNVTLQSQYYTEWLGGPAPRVYRRAKFEALMMSIETCADGEKVKRTDTDVMSRPSTVCNWCRKTSSEPFKRCSRCLAVSYCSRECQRGEFKKHKMACRRYDRYDIARARVYPGVRFFLNLRHAKDYSVLLKNMPTEEQHERGAWCNLLVEVLGQIPHFRRYIFLVRDLEGTVTKVVFHDETNVYTHPSHDSIESLPRGLKTCLVPGHFLLMLGVAWRNFHDGTVGIRVNDLTSVYVINMADHGLSSEYRQEVEQIVSGYDDSPRIRHPVGPEVWASFLRDFMEWNNV